MSNRTNWSYLIMAYSALLALGFVDNSRGPAYPSILETFSIGTKEGSWIFSLSSGTGLLVNMTTKYWLAPLGVITSLRLALFLIFLGCLGIGMAANLPNGLLWLYLSSCLLGSGMGFSGVGHNLLTARGAPAKYRRQAFSALHSCYGIASLMAPLALAWYQKDGGHWGRFFVLISFIPLIIMSLSFLSKEKEIHMDKRKPLVPPLSLFQRLPIGFVFGFYVASEITVSSRIVLFLERAHGYDPIASKQHLSFYFICLMAGRLLFAFLPTKGKPHFYLISSTLLSLIVFAFAYNGYPNLIFISGLTMSFFFPVGMEWLSTHFNLGLEYMTASAMTMMGISLFALHALFGIISEWYGLKAAFLMAPICQIIALILVITSEYYILKNYQPISWSNGHEA